MIDSKSIYTTIKAYDQTIAAKPFLKWAGGKSQLVPKLSTKLPKEIVDTGVIDSYIEPFVEGAHFSFILKVDSRLIIHFYWI